jgi:hypothetical protein
VLHGVDDHVPVNIGLKPAPATPAADAGMIDARLDEADQRLENAKRVEEQAFEELRKAKAECARMLEAMQQRVQAAEAQARAVVQSAHDEADAVARAAKDQAGRIKNQAVEEQAELALAADQQMQEWDAGGEAGNQKKEAAATAADMVRAAVDKLRRCLKNPGASGNGAFMAALQSICAVAADKRRWADLSLAEGEVLVHEATLVVVDAMQQQTGNGKTLALAAAMPPSAQPAQGPQLDLNAIRTGLQVFDYLLPRIRRQVGGGGGPLLLGLIKVLLAVIGKCEADFEVATACLLDLGRLAIGNQWSVKVMVENGIIDRLQSVIPLYLEGAAPDEVANDEGGLAIAVAGVGDGSAKPPAGHRSAESLQLAGGMTASEMAYAEQQKTQPKAFSMDLLANVNVKVAAAPVPIAVVSVAGRSPSPPTGGGGDTDSDDDFGGDDSSDDEAAKAGGDGWIRSRGRSLARNDATPVAASPSLADSSSGAVVVSGAAAAPGTPRPGQGGDDFTENTGGRGGIDGAARVLAAACLCFTNLLYNNEALCEDMCEPMAPLLERVLMRHRRDAKLCEVATCSVGALSQADANVPTLLRYRVVAAMTAAMGANAKAPALLQVAAECVLS